MSTSGYTIIDPHGAITVDNQEGGGVMLRTLQVRDPKDGRLVRIPLTTAIMRELGYHCCLWYQKATGENTLMPTGFTHPEPRPNDARHAPPAETPTPPAPRVRVRTAPPPVTPPPAPTPRVRTRTFTP